MSGWIKLHRSLLDWEWYDDINVSRLFLHLMLKANHKDRKYKGTLIKRGQLLTGRELLSNETGLSQQQIRTCLTKLKSTSDITIESTSKGTLLTVDNYDVYQGADSESTSKTTSNLTNEQPAINQQSTTNKNVKNLIIKEVKNITPDRFAEFWDLYSKKTGLKKCKAKFSKLKNEDIDLIFERLPAYIKTTPDKQYRKDPVTWLNGRCWDDEIISNDPIELATNFKPREFNQ